MAWPGSPIPARATARRSGARRPSTAVASTRAWASGDVAARRCRTSREKERGTGRGPSPRTRLAGSSSSRSIPACRGLPPVCSRSRSAARRDMASQPWARARSIRSPALRPPRRRRPPVSSAIREMPSGSTGASSRAQNTARTGSSRRRRRAKLRAARLGGSAQLASSTTTARGPAAVSPARDSSSWAPTASGSAGGSPGPGRPARGSSWPRTPYGRAVSASSAPAHRTATSGRLASQWRTRVVLPAPLSPSTTTTRRLPPRTAASWAVRMASSSRLPTKLRWRGEGDGSRGAALLRESDATRRPYPGGAGA